MQDHALKRNIERDKVILFKKNMKTQEKINEKITILESAIMRLSEACDIDPTGQRIIIDGTIQRFEFSFDLFWKTLKDIFQARGADVQFPKDVLKAAYQGSLISDSKIYIDMLFDRNESSHIYDLYNADRIYSNIKTIYLPLLLHDMNSIKGRFYKHIS